MTRHLVPLFALLLALSACAPSRIPPGPGPTTPEIVMLQEGQRPAIQRIVMDDGASLRLRSWLPKNSAGKPVAPRAAILALHGFNDYSRAFHASGRDWAKAGVATYAYDQRGFGDHGDAGLWAGTERLTADVRTAAKVIAARHPDVPLYLLGESMGGAVALVAQAKAPIPEVRGTILSAPAVWARERMPGYQSASLWFFSRVIPWGKLSGGGLNIQPSDNIPMLIALGRDPLIIKRTRVDAIDGLTDLMSAALAAAPRFEAPALLLYGEKDEIVPPGPTLELWRDLPQQSNGRQRRVLYSDGWHMLLRDLQAGTVRDDILAWIDDPTAPLPSGADKDADPRLEADAEGPAEATEDSAASE